MANAGTAVRTTQTLRAAPTDMSGPAGDPRKKITLPE